MRLNLHRRHSENCAGGRTPWSRSYETDELRRASKKCYCPIYASGTLGGAFRRKNTDATGWDEAKIVAIGWAQAGSWDEVPAQLVPSDRVPLPPCPDHAGGDCPGKFTIENATSAYIANREGRKIARATLNKYRTLVKQLRAFAESKGYVMLDQLISVTDMDEFYLSWKDGVRAKGKKLERLKGFFDFCVKRKMIKENPADDLEAPIGAGSAANKAPYSDPEIEKQYEVCRRMGTVNWKNGMGEGESSGEDVATFIMLECFTGLRISDAATFDMKRLNGNECFLRMHKSKKPLFTWLPDELVLRLETLAKKTGSQRPFMTLGGSTRMETAADLWRRKLNKVWELCGEWEEPPHPHRFRHTFVRILLQNGVSPADVAELIGDTEEMVRKHYARWVPERQARLTGIVREALSSTPRPLKLVAIAGGKRTK